MIGNLTNTTPQELDELTLKDYSLLQKRLSGFFVLDWSSCLRGIALLGAVLHQGFNDCLEMSMQEFRALIKEARRAVK
ncbi:hypothetical protein AGMMS50229_07040 [Campylobacterota bacterium]|nr:hypothetical protein AGMMS50229_07040 [Campylobacterota bacterium]